MDQDVLRWWTAAAVLSLMAWMIGFGVMLRKRGVNTNAIAEKNTNLFQRGLVAGAGLLDLYLIFRAPFPVLDAWVAARPAPFPIFALCVLVSSASIIIASQAGMGRSWRVGVPGEKNHVDDLVIGGLHRFSRNPTYFGIMLFLVGAFLAAPGPFTLFAIVVSYGGLTIIIGQEERYLEARFGDAYAAYKRRVRRWI